MIDAADLEVLKTARKLQRLQNLISCKKEPGLRAALTRQLDHLFAELVDGIGKLDASREATVDG